MKLSILDQSPIASGKTAHEALQESMKLAQIGEKLGYNRYWIAEHHDMAGLACSVPEVMLGYIGAKTKRIRLGSGAVLLPHYKPYKVAEIFNLLATLFPERIDIGIGRAPGGSAEVTMALSDQFLEKVWKMPELIEELLHFLYQDFPSDHMFSKISAAPLPEKPPQTWLLGTSEKSAKVAAEKGIAYTFGHFMSDKDGAAIVKHYKESFKANNGLNRPVSMIAVTAICAETTERAEELALSTLIWQIETGKGNGKNGIPSFEEARQYTLTEKEQEMIDSMRKKMVIGNPEEVRQQLLTLQETYEVDEIMIVTNVHCFQERIQSYEWIAKAML
ncbi:LLM class flavin-dependent oxidoreductase [Halalkalibacterium ligniniphilum]|uniref:LLM class flavin-dependent oxidoreductase n=1 Tax=Halalkalibacterium ligniniphilum TaxID=1134413 RepID=UPI000347BC7B|nr:LLM class flavin-dependent oxidoreductase [Halalkalibacterium ligniniphilum]